MITRANLGWNAVNVGRSNTDKGMVVHYDGRNQRLVTKTCEACRRYWTNTREFHVHGNGWSDIGYAYGFCPHGETYEGRGYGRVQAAARHTPGKLPNGNYDWVNVTFMSGPDEPPTDVQVHAFQQMRHKLMKLGMKGAVRCHQDFTATDCPGKWLTNRVRSGTLIEPVKGIEMEPRDIWNHEIPVPWGTPENREWQADSLLVNANQRIRSLEGKIDLIMAALGVTEDE